MSQSKTNCPRCGRHPGDLHLSDCPRSSTMLKALHASLAKPFRLVWKKGFLAFKKPALFGMTSQIGHTFNPGVPFVNGPNRRAGGVPRGKSEEAGIFLRDLGLEKAP